MVDEQIQKLQRGDLIQNIETREIWRVNGDFGDGVIIADIVDNNIELLTSFEGWKEFMKNSLTSI